MPRYPWAVKAGGPLLTGGGGLPPKIFGWNPEIAQELPATSTFTRASIAQVLTTTDGTFWYQKAKSGEVHLDGLRRVENLIDVPLSSFNLTFGASFSDPQLDMGTSQLSGMERPVDIETAPRAGATFCASARVRRVGGSDVQFRLKCTHAAVADHFSANLTATADYQIFTFTQVFANSDGSAVTVGVVNQVGGGVKSVDVDWIQLEKVQDGSDTFGGLVEFGVSYNAEADGVRYFNTTNGNSVDGSGVVTEATGTTITGGYLSEPSATNLVTSSDDISDGSWTKTNITPTNQGVLDIGLTTWRLDAGVANGIHVIEDTVPSTGNAAISVRAKAVTGRYLTMRVDAGATTEFAVFDLQTGTITEEGSGIIDAFIEDLGNSWYECILTNVSTVNLSLLLGISDVATPGTSQPSFAGVNETIDVAIPQSEATLFQTSPIVTSGSTVTRVADVLDTGAIIPSEFGALLDVTMPLVIGTGNTISLLGPDATALDIIRVDANFQIIMADGAGPIVIGTTSSGARTKIAYGRDSSGRSGSVDGATAVTSTPPGSGHEGNTFQIGASNSVNQSRSIHHNSVIYSVRPTDEELEDLSS